MPYYTLTHPDANVTKEHLDDVITQQGMTAVDYGIGYVVVDSDKVAIEKFQKSFDWIVTEYGQSGVEIDPIEMPGHVPENFLDQWDQMQERRNKRINDPKPKP